MLHYSIAKGILDHERRDGAIFKKTDELVVGIKRPLSIEEEIPCKCRRLVVGTGAGALPIMDEVKHEANRREIGLVIQPTAEAIKTLQENPVKINAVLHVTC